MRTTAPQLLPLFRSDGQGRLLARVYLHEPASLAELARELDLDDGGIAREADRLERAGLVRSERVGRSRILHPDERSPYYRDLYGLLLKAYGPATFIGSELASLTGIDRAYIFGSWAARYLDVPGPAPADIDVLVVGSPDPTALYESARTLEELLGREVNPVIVSHERWDAEDEGFIREVKRAPLLELELDRESGGPVVS